MPATVPFSMPLCVKGWFLGSPWARSTGPVVFGVVVVVVLVSGPGSDLSEEPVFRM
jgi:hypothetical protein